jgi:two-component system, NarL family, response regulator LiaR
MPNNNQHLLSASEIAVIHLLSKGLMYKEIAEALSININTVKKHCKNSYKKLQVRNRTEACIKFISAAAA